MPTQVTAPSRTRKMFKVGLAVKNLSQGRQQQIAWRLGARGTTSRVSSRKMFSCGGVIDQRPDDRECLVIRWRQCQRVRDDVEENEAGQAGMSL